MSNDGELPTLWIGLLGPPEIKWDSSSLTLARRQTRALLYRLAVHPSPISRSQLAFLFWADMPETSARRNLTHLLTLVRQALPHPDLLFSDGERVALNPQHTQSDTIIFATLTDTSDIQARPDALMQAVELYRGPLLEGFALPDCPEFESWLDEERRIWERRYDDVLAAVVEAQTVRGNYTAAIATAHRALARDNLAEEMHRRLIELYGATGDRAAALRQFEECALVLDRELGVAPLPETRAVYEAVRDGLSHVVPRTAPLPAEWRETKLTSHTVPLPPSSLIGRSAMLADVLTLLQREGVRLLTLTGPGGTGKTRVALELARKLEGSFVGNVVFVPLAPLRDPTQVLGAIAAALGLSERDNRPPLLRLGDALAMRESILVLDNFEHLLEAAQDVAALLLAAPRLKVLVTSRALLNIVGEHAYPVPPLDLPDLQRFPISEELAKVSAVTLFLERVRERVPTFELTNSNAAYIAAICVRLDGLPLAIELAAARAVLLSPRMLLARLDQRLALLTGGPRDLPARQRTLRATIDWSYDLLDVGEQHLLGRLAAFAGSWTLEAAEQISLNVGPLSMSVLDGLHVLLDKHMVLRRAEADGEPRFTMLETVREYALERLTARGELQAAQAAHAGYYRQLAERVSPLLQGPEQIGWFERLDEEHANLRVALDWLLHANDVVGALQLAVALYHFWYVRGHFTEGHTWLNRSLAQLSSDLLATSPAHHSPLIAHACLAAAHFTLIRGELIAACQQLEPLVADLRRLATTMQGDSYVRKLLTQALMRLFQAEGMLGKRPDPMQVDEMVTLAKSLNEPHTLGEHYLGYGRGMLYGLGRPDLAQPMLERAEEIFRALGDRWSLSMIMTDLGMVALFAGEVAKAECHLSEARAEAVALRDRFLEAEALNNLGEIARLTGDDATAQVYYAATLAIYRQLDSKGEIPRLMHNFGYLALHAGNIAQARADFIESLHGFRRSTASRGIAEVLAGLAAVAVSTHLPEPTRLAAQLWNVSDGHHRERGTILWPPDQAERTRYEALARATLGTIGYEKAYAEGAGLSLEEAIVEALRL